MPARVGIVDLKLFMLSDYREDSININTIEVEVDS